MYGEYPDQKHSEPIQIPLKKKINLNDFNGVMLDYQPKNMENVHKFTFIKFKEDNQHINQFTFNFLNQRTLTSLLYVQ